MFFELFSYVEGIVNPSKIDNLNELAKDLANGSVVQVDADVDGELAVSENEFQADKDFGNPVEGDGAWKSFSSIGEEFMQGGVLNRNVPNVATYSIGATVVEKHHNPNPILKMANGGAVAEGWTDAELMADGGGVSKRGGLYSVGDKVMVNDNGYMKYFHGFDLTKPATIISKGKVKSSRGIVYFYGLELADGRKPYNNAPESLLTLVNYAKGGIVFDEKLKERLLSKGVINVGDKFLLPNMEITPSEFSDLIEKHLANRTKIGLYNYEVMALYTNNVDGSERISLKWIGKHGKGYSSVDTYLDTFNTIRVLLRYYDIMWKTHGLGEKRSLEAS